MAAASIVITLAMVVVVRITRLLMCNPSRRVSAVLSYRWASAGATVGDLDEARPRPNRLLAATSLTASLGATQERETDVVNWTTPRTAWGAPDLQGSGTIAR